MARKSLRPQLNQIRAWVRQGRTDAWIAHQLEVTAAQLRDFRRRHALTGEGEDTADVDLRDEIEAEIEAELDAAPTEEAEEEEEAEEAEEAEEVVETEEEEEAAAGAEGEAEEKPKPRRRRRRRRGGRRRGKRALEATFDHGEKEGYGLWLDAAVKDDSTYTEHWAGHRALKVTIEPDRIILERIEDDE
jgi:hypothetical protein